jgi:hypothetical protein
MSTLSQFAAGGIKSIQRGTITVSTTATATITAVNTAKTMLNFCGCSSGILGASSSVALLARIALTSGTQVTASGLSAFPNYTPIVSYEVIEYF